jgi:hypothetical protein
MAAVLHLLKGADVKLPLAVIVQEVRAGDDVTVALLPGAPTPAALPAGVHVRRVRDDLSYAELLDLVFGADRVVTW